jgi:hypothetical protein
MEIEFEWDTMQQIFVEHAKNCLDLAIRFDNDEAEIKSYLFVISDNLSKRKFIEYVKEKDLEAHCQEIFQRYESYL